MITREFPRVEIILNVVQPYKDESMNNIRALVNQFYFAAPTPAASIYIPTTIFEFAFKMVAIIFFRTRFSKCIIYIYIFTLLTGEKNNCSGGDCELSLCMLSLLAIMLKLVGTRAWAIGCSVPSDRTMQAVSAGGDGPMSTDRADRTLAFCTSV